MNYIDLSIIIVNYRTKDITLQCLRSIFASQTHFAYEVILVDNASGDDSIAAFKQQHYPRLTIIENPHNGGFAQANNLGVKSAQGKYVWLLNSDTILQPDTLEKLLSLVYKHHSYIATCCLLNSDGSIQPQGGALPTLLNLTTWMLNLDAFPLVAKLIPPYQEYRQTIFLNPQSRHVLGWIGGTAMLVRRDLYLAMSGLDENIFMYGEDVEFCLRAHKGFIYPNYFPQAKLVHLGQASGSSQRAILGEFSGLKYIFKKHKPPSQSPLLRVILKCGCLLRAIMYTLTGDIKKRDIYVKALTLV